MFNNPHLMRRRPLDLEASNFRHKASYKKRPGFHVKTLFRPQGVKMMPGQDKRLEPKALRRHVHGRRQGEEPFALPGTLIG